MADSPLCPYCCGTGASGWIDGDHPSVQEGKVERKVKTDKNGDFCNNFNSSFILKNLAFHFILDKKS